MSPHAESDMLVRWTLALLGLAFFCGLFNHSLVPSMEPRFAEVVREMLTQGDWLVPIKNARPYVEYPVFYYWLAIVGKMLGLSMTAAIRLPSYIAYFAWLNVLFRWQTDVIQDRSAYALVIAGAAMPLVLFQFSIAQTDSLLALGALLAMYGYTRLICGDAGRSFPWLMWSGVALATLAKGPVGIAVTLPVFAIDRILVGLSPENRAGSDGSRRLLRTVGSSLAPVHWVSGLALVMLVNVPWYLLAGMNRGWVFVNAVLIYQNVDRYLTGYSHLQPWWYYFKTIAYDFFPASLLMPAGIWTLARAKLSPVQRLVLIWALWTFVFFSVSGSKQGKYLLPMAPAILALAFYGLAAIEKIYGQMLGRWIRRWYIGVILLWSIALIFVLPFYSAKIGGRDGFESIRAQLERAPGELISYRWPRSLTLYELGGPMPFVRSARELYTRINSGEFAAGDYVLVEKSKLGMGAGDDAAEQLMPYPNPDVFEPVLTTDAAKTLVLLRIRKGATSAPIPKTPAPPVLLWRDRLFDTD